MMASGCPVAQDPVEQGTDSLLHSAVLRHADDLVLGNATGIEAAPVVGGAVKNLQGG